MKAITFGSDPEFFLADQDGNLRSAIGIIKGTKENRLDIGGGHRIYYDNVLAECEISPAVSAADAVKKFQDCFQKYANAVKPYRLVVRASATMPKAECEHDDAKVFGCEPEYDAYDVQVVSPPMCEEGNTFRSAGGHIHVGYEGGANPDDDEELAFAVAWDRIWVARMCDLFLGIPSLVMDHDPTSKARRKLYGGAGSHRPCDKYGIEYRSLSNFWLAQPALVNLMYQLAQCAVNVVMEARQHEHIWEKVINPTSLRRTINNGDVVRAEHIMAKVLPKYVPGHLLDRIEELSGPGPVDFYKQWSLV